MHKLQRIPHNVGLSKEDNPEYFDLFDRRNTLVDEWNELNRSLLDLKQPKVWLRGHESKIGEKGRQSISWENKYLDWDNDARQFLLEPHLTFSGHQERELGYLHFCNRLSDLIFEMMMDKTLLSDNHYKVAQAHLHQVNTISFLVSFIIAILSFLIAIIALIIAL